MKLFRDYEAKRMFASLYESLEPHEQSEFASLIRDAADEKVNSIDDSMSDFYLSRQDVENCFLKVTRSLK